MRIDCEKCGAAFAIDDKLIPARGVRAQCPRCRHVKLVTRPAEPPEPPRAKAPEAPKRSDPKPPPRAPVGTDDTQPIAARRTVPNPDDLTSPAIPPFKPPSSSEKAKGEALVSSAKPSAPPVIAKTRKSSPGQSRATAIEDAPAPIPRSEATERIVVPTAPVRAPTDEVQGASTTCRSCGKALTDAFDQALGICDDCRQKAAETMPPLDAPVRAAASTPSSPKNPVAAAPAMNFARADSKPRSRWPLFAGAGAIVALIVTAAVVAFVVRPFKPVAPPPPDIPEAISETVPRWKLSFVGLTGEAPEFLKEGQAALSNDTPSSYLDAEEAYQKALILDPQSDEAIIGYCRALALGRGTVVDDATLKEALGLITAAEKRTHDSALSLVAEAELRLTRPGLAENVERARSLAERAASAKEPEVRAEAELVLGRTFTATSLALALQHFDTALSLSPTLARVHYERALAHESAGDLRQAMASLQERLKSDPDQPEALASLSRMYQEVGDTASARQVYQRVLDKRPGDFHASLMLAVLLYQTEGKTAEAVKALKALAKLEDRYEDRDKVELFVHLAAAQRAQGDADGALDSVMSALSTSSSDAGAHLQGLLLALDKGLAAEAARHLAFVQGHLGDPALERMMEARVRLEEQKFDAAAAAYKDAASADPRRLDAVIMSGVAFARAANRDGALRALTPLLEADPTRLAPRAIVTRYYLAPGETVKDADGWVGKLSSSPQDVVPREYQALIDWHRGKRDDAEKLFKEVIAEDEGDAVAHSYLSLIALANKQNAAAKSEGERAVGAGRQKAIAHYAYASALVATGDKERAGKELAEAESVSPRFLPVQLSIASLDASAKETERARARLVRTLASDPSYLAAKRLLYSLGDQR
ncbi:MAG: tetratricopeptide repeat protein [Myxococcaceae bacterium]